MNLTHVRDDDGPAAGVHMPDDPGAPFNSNVLDERRRISVRGDDGQAIFIGPVQGQRHPVRIQGS